MAEKHSTWQSDRDYEEVRLKSVKRSGDGYELTRDDGWSLFLNDPGFEPKVGDTARFYGKGIGHIVRGVVINGRVAFYQTQAESDAKHQQWVDDQARERREKFERDRESMDARYDALPDVFRTRLDRFRAANPDFRWEYEPYELFCCEEALKIARSVHGDVLPAFGKLSWEQQKMVVPDLSDDHSGNTFGMAVRLAHWYNTQPENVALEHGALVPLVGCKDYGCAHTADLRS